MSGLLLAVALAMAGQVRDAVPAPARLMPDERVEKPVKVEELAEKVETIWLRKQGCWGEGRKILNGPHAGLYRITRKWAGDPWGFIGLVNWYRVNYFRDAWGHPLPPVMYDSNLSRWAALNNGPQLSAKYSGHHVNPNVWQIAYFFYGQRTARDAVVGFLNSPAHAAVIADPNIRRMGVSAGTDGVNMAWTANAGY
jgi:hypothetical protein